MDFIKHIKKAPAILVVVAVWVLFASPYLFLNKTPYPSDYQVNYFSPIASYPILKGPVKNNAQPDIIGQIYPWKNFTIGEIKHGRLPFWNPYSFSGTPHLANYQSAVLSPFNIFFLLPIPFITIWGLLVVLQPLLAGLFTYLLARVYRISEKGSLVSAISFMFCGFIVTWMGYATLPYAILPLPLALFFIEKFAITNKFRYEVLLALCIPLSFFSGHFQTSIYFLLAVLSYIFYCFLFRGTSRMQYLKLLWFVACGLFLCAPQLLPSIELYFQSVRSILFQKNEAIPLQYVATFLSPDFFGNPVTRNDWFGHYAEWNGYAGAIALFLAGVGAFSRKVRVSRYFIILALLSLLFAFDTPFLTLLITLKLPVLSTSAASRVIVLFSFSIAILAGFGFDQIWIRAQAGKRKFLILLSILCISCVVLFLLPILAHIPLDKINIAVKNSVLPIISLAILVFVVLLNLKFKSKKIIKFFQLAILLLVIFDMIRFATKWQSFSPTALVYPEVPVASFFGKLNHVDRAVGLSGAEDGLYYRVPILTGYDPLYIKTYGELMSYVVEGKKEVPGRSVVGFPTSGKYTPQTLDMMGVRYIVHKASDKNYAWAFPFSKYPKGKFNKIYDDKIFAVYENTYPQKRAYLVANIKKTSREKVIEEMYRSDLRYYAIVSEDTEGVDGNATGSATISKYDSTYVAIDINSTGKQLLVLSDNYYPGWKATVNNVSTKIISVNNTLRGVIIPKGASQVVFSYTPESFMVGVYLSLIGLLGIIVVKVLSIFRYD